MRWVVADWGLVRRPPGETGEFVTNVGLGTEGFAAPEVWMVAHDVDRRADVYSLGRVIAWALTRHPPVPNIDLPAPGRWRALVAKMTAHDREARHDGLAAVTVALSELQSSGSSSSQLIAFGPDVIAEGELIEIAGQSWSIDVDRLLVGDEHALLRLTDGFQQLQPHERHITLERQGEARLLDGPPRFTRKGAGWSVQATVASRFARTDVDQIDEDISLEDFGRTLRGRDRLPQIFLIALSTEKGELIGDPHWGSVIRRRFTEIGDAPLFERAVALEATRLASVPYTEDSGASSTPLRCVERIISLKLSPGKNAAHRRTRIVAEVRGFGRWEGAIDMRVASEPHQTGDEATKDRKAILAELLGAARTPSAKPGWSTPVPVPVAHPFVAPIASLMSKAGTPVEPILWLFIAKLASHSSRTKTEQHAALMGSLVEQDGDFQRRTQWPRVLRLSDVQAESAAIGTMWRFAYRTGATNQAADEQLVMDRDGNLSFQRAMFWDVETPALDFGALAFDCIVIMKFAERYAAKIGAASVTIDLRVSTPRGAKELLAVFTTSGADAEQPGRSGRLRHPLPANNVTVSLATGAANDAYLVQGAKRLLDGIANEFELESSAFGTREPPFLAINESSLAAVVRALR